MALFVQLADTKGVSVWHNVISFVSEDGGGSSSLDFKRRYELGCGKFVVGPASQLADADAPPWTHRHVAKGCFTTTEDPQK